MKRNLFILCVIVLGCMAAVQESWICDDAFLSFRYAENLASGKGLVFNEGEYVEGYSNFLWTLLISVGMKLGFAPEGLAQVMGVLFYAMTLYALSFVGRSLVALCSGAAIFHMHVYATAGLESSLFWFLLVSLFLSLRADRAKTSAGVCFLLLLCRPEGMIFAPLSIFVLTQHRRDFVLCITPLWLGYFVWKLWYFGDLLPNTYWAKGNESRWEQGFLYMFLFWKMYFLGVFGLFGLFRMEKRISLFVFGTIFIMTVQLTKGGGGFMYARLALPILLYLLISVDVWLSEVLAEKWLYPAAIFSGLCFFFAPYPKELADGATYEGIVEEKYWYPSEEIEKAQRLGTELRKMVEGSDARVAILGAQAMIAYYAKIPYVLEAMAGLTDRDLARLPARNGRIGHGQKATLSYMRERNIDVLLSYRNTVPAPDVVRISLGEMKGVLIQYRSHIMSVWKEKGALFVDMPQYVDELLASQKKISQEEYDFLLTFYFLPSQDEERKEKLRKNIFSP